MKRNSTIMYALDSTTGEVISRVGSEVAMPVLCYNDMLPENNFETKYSLQKMPVGHLASIWHRYKWTRKIPLHRKNEHRKFWGMKPLKRAPNVHELEAVWKGLEFKWGGETFKIKSIKIDGNTPIAFVQDSLKRKIPWSLDVISQYLTENPGEIKT